VQIEMPLEFHKACRNLGQDLASKARVMSEAEANALLVQTTMIGIDRTEAKVIREFIGELLNSDLTSDQLVEFWRKTPAEIYFYDGGQVEGFLKLLSAGLAQPPYREA
jgi:hypothetical protein